ncbi:hypothetical protein BN6_57800 [Saccharothrix espanaensis DSM 44229]|uniref:Uncharacterized protein n=1 Tax=Saccharothrix espanaensis (strain ATCC 51144 / DSM 44229 / JCM 9112 / NBRC 15066 / NRRL 15764) TaxID=1179773 RepID=K0K674_SACES|nr:hypothetical protein BN6_57800 [Saccharothrix espanaensis DSM 44229]
MVVFPTHSCARDAAEFVVGLLVLHRKQFGQHRAEQEWIEFEADRVGCGRDALDRLTETESPRAGVVGEAVEAAHQRAEDACFQFALRLFHRDRQDPPPQGTGQRRRRPGPVEHRRRGSEDLIKGRPLSEGQGGFEIIRPATEDPTGLVGERRA